MFRINQLEQENGFLFQQHMECQITLQLWMEDHKRVSVENQDLRRELQGKEMQRKSLMEAHEYSMNRMEEKQKQLEEKSKFWNEDSWKKDQLIERMAEEMSIQKQETESLARQYQSMMMIMQAHEEEEACKKENEREEKENELRSTQEQLKRSEEARGALKAEMEKLRELLEEREGEQKSPLSTAS